MNTSTGVELHLGRNLFGPLDGELRARRLADGPWERTPSRETLQQALTYATR